MPERRAAICAEISVVDAVKHALTTKFGTEDISRVMASFSSAVVGESLEADAGRPQHQRATSFIEGLDAEPFSDDWDAKYGWVSYLEQNSGAIRDELLSVTAQDDLAQRGNNVWAPPVVEAATTYGPDWRTLVLQDRVWDPINTALFPVTTKILRNSAAAVPCVEAFFARQAPGTGIKLHTDDCNFILTMHLGLNVPEQQSWIEVGGLRRYWDSGKALVFNTSFFHQTMNESTDQDRTVLLIRFWHPDLSAVERRALQHLFLLIEDPDMNADVQSARLELTHAELSKKAKQQDSGRSSSSGKGFGN